MDIPPEFGLLKLGVAIVGAIVGVGFILHYLS